MNSYSLGLAGSWWLVVLIILAAAAFAFYSYRVTVPPVSSGRRSLLLFLRTLAISLLLFVLFEPVLNIVRSTEEPPHLAVLLDNSLSMSFKDAQSDRRESFKSSLNSAKPFDIDESATTLLFSDDIKRVQNFTFDSLKLKGQLSDISKPLNYVLQNAEPDNLRAALLITDGAFNSGNNPLNQAELIGRPLYIIGIGDSTEPRDISVQSIVTNDVAYIETTLPVNVNVKSAGFTEGSITVVLKDNGAKIAEQIISLKTDQQLYTTSFQYIPKQEGIRKLTAEIAPREGEITTKNNAASEFVKVLKTKRQIVLFAGAPSPDVSFIRNEILKEKGAEIQTFIQKQGAEFYEGNPGAGVLKEAELIILIGFPNSASPSNVIQQIAQEAGNGKPVLFVLSQQTDFKKLQPLEAYLPFTTVSSRPQEFLALADVKQDQASNPLLKITGTDGDIAVWNQLPPLFRTETFVKVKPESEVAATIRVNNVPLAEPLIVSRSFQRSKSIALLGYGLYRWKLAGQAADIFKGKTDAPDVLNAFLQNSSRWLTADNDQKTVRIRTNKKLYTSGERVEFIAQVYDAAYTPLDNADVRVKINGGKSPRDIVMQPIGNGRYTANLDGMPEGDYSFTGDARQNSRALGSDNGRFSVGEIALEYQNLRMNVELLRALAERTGGKFYTPAQAAAFKDDLLKSKNFAPRPVTKRNEFALWNLPWLLGAAILAFALEWFLRKRSGLI
ncbi:MAG: vWA domain-containing protein [Bacteroidota bacterium]